VRNGEASPAESLASSGNSLAVNSGQPKLSSSWTAKAEDEWEKCERERALLGCFGSGSSGLRAGLAWARPSEREKVKRSFLFLYF
jgi:hypothetical protein